MVARRVSAIPSASAVVSPIDLDLTARHHSQRRCSQAVIRESRLRYASPENFDRALPRCTFDAHRRIVRP